MKGILLATNNAGKVERFRNLLKEVDPGIIVHTPRDLGLETIDVPETGKTLAENAALKVRAYAGKTSLPILGNDTGFWVEGDGFVDAPKRAALGETPEHLLTKEEIGAKLIAFWKGVATRHGGKVNAAWMETFVCLYPDGTMKSADSRRDVILTDTEFGTAHIQMPVRALYLSKATNKPAITHTHAEEILEMQPVIAALRAVLE